MGSDLVTGTIFFFLCMCHLFTEPAACRDRALASGLVANHHPPTHTHTFPNPSPSLLIGFTDPLCPLQFCPSFFPFILTHFLRFFLPCPKPISVFITTTIFAARKHDIVSRSLLTRHKNQPRAHPQTRTDSFFFLPTVLIFAEQSLVYGPSSTIIKIPVYSLKSNKCLFFYVG